MRCRSAATCSIVASSSGVMMKRGSYVTRLVSISQVVSQLSTQVQRAWSTSSARVSASFMVPMPRADESTVSQSVGQPIQVRNPLQVAVERRIEDGPLELRQEPESAAVGVLQTTSLNSGLPKPIEHHSLLRQRWCGDLDILHDTLADVTIVGRADGMIREISPRFRTSQVEIDEPRQRLRWINRHLHDQVAADGLLRRAIVTRATWPTSWRVLLRVISISPSFSQ